jgi:hypothetical protein
MIEKKDNDHKQIKQPSKVDTRSILPDSLRDLWDEEIAPLFYGLDFHDQTFVLEYLKHGIGTRAYAKAFPRSTPEVHAALASRKIRQAKVKAFLDAVREHNIEDYFLVSTQLRNTIAGKAAAILDEDGNVVGQEPPTLDHRLKATAQLAKISGLNAPEKIEDDRFTMLVKMMKEKQNGQG